MGATQSVLRAATLIILIGIVAIRIGIVCYPYLDMAPAFFARRRAREARGGGHPADG